MDTEFLDEEVLGVESWIPMDIQLLIQAAKDVGSSIVYDIASTQQLFDSQWYTITTLH